MSKLAPPYLRGWVHVQCYDKLCEFISEYAADAAADHWLVDDDQYVSRKQHGLTPL
jgi:hypothetical protein